MDMEVKVSVTANLEIVAYAIFVIIIIIIIDKCKSSIKGDEYAQQWSSTTTVTELSLSTVSRTYTYLYHYRRREAAAFHYEERADVLPMPTDRSRQRPVKVRLFYLQAAFKSEAENLKEIFREIPPCATLYGMNWGVFPVQSVSSSEIELLTFDDLIALMEVNDPPYSDAVVILGHSNLYSFESLDFTDILGALLHPKPPLFLVFLGCCGGNPRYGPLKQLSLLPEWQNTIFSYFQRQVYKDELCNTIPVLALQYYLHLDLKLPQWHNSFFVMYSIGCAYSLHSKNNFECDSSCFFNQKCELSSAQQFLSIIKSFGIQTKEIPLSCW